MGFKIDVSGIKASMELESLIKSAEGDNGKLLALQERLENLYVDIMEMGIKAFKEGNWERERECQKKIEILRPHINMLRKLVKASKGGANG